MALKSKLTKAEFDALPDAIKEHYKESGGNYLLDSDDARELREAKDREAEARRQEKDRADRLQAEKDTADKEAREAREAKAKKDKDFDALETSYKEREALAVATEKAKTEKREQQLRELLVENKALELANEISTSPKLILPHIRARLQAELDGEKPLTRVLDADGKVSAKTIPELRQEFVDNAEFKAIIKASNASGGGAGGGSGSGNGIPADKEFSKLSEAERVALQRADPVAFRERAKAAGVNIPH